MYKMTTEIDRTGHGADKLPVSFAMLPGGYLKNVTEALAPSADTMIGAVRLDAAETVSLEQSRANPKTVALRFYGASSPHGQPYHDIEHWAAGCCAPGVSPRTLEPMLAYADGGVIKSAQLVWRTPLCDPDATLTPPPMALKRVGLPRGSVGSR